MKSLDAFLALAKGHAAAMFNRTGEHVPTFMLHGLDELVVVPAPCRDQREKEIAVLAVKEIAKALGATRVAVITEGWMVVRPLGSQTEGVVPSEEPDRVEVVWIIAQSASPSEKSIGGVFKIERDRRSGKAKLGEWTSMEGGQTTSIFDRIVGGGILQ